MPSSLIIVASVAELRPWLKVFVGGMSTTAFGGIDAVKAAARGLARRILTTFDVLAMGSLPGCYAPSFGRVSVTVCGRSEIISHDASGKL